MKIRIDKKERQVIIEEYFQIGGTVVPNSRCEDCGSVIIYYDKHDNEFCPNCNSWLTKPCADNTCIYCRSRPITPLEVRTLADKENEIL